MLFDYKPLVADTLTLKQKQELEQEAQNFIRSLNPEEMEIMQLQDSYSTKLEMLEQFHEEQLISEET